MTDTITMTKADGEPYDFKALHALRHRATIDVYAAGLPDETPPVPPQPGVLLVDYLPTAMANKAITDGIEHIQAAAATEGWLPVADALVDILSRVLYSWSLPTPLTRDALYEAGPFIMGDILRAIGAETQAKNANGGNTTVGSSMTPSRPRGSKRSS